MILVDIVVVERFLIFSLIFINWWKWRGFTPCFLTVPKQEVKTNDTPWFITPFNPKEENKENKYQKEKVLGGS